MNPFANITPVVKNLLIINILFFVGDFTIGKYIPQIMQYLPAYYFGSSNFRVWEIITYMFMHGGFTHIFFNMFALFSFGPILEYSMGSKKFFNFYFLCGIGAVLFNMAIAAYQVHNITGAFILPNSDVDATFLQYGDQAQKLYGAYNGQIVGASGAIFGLLIAFGMMYPDMKLMIMFIPVPIKAKYIIPVYIFVELYLGYEQFSWDNVAHFAHLGGALIGFALVKIWRLQRPNNFY